MRFIPNNLDDDFIGRNDDEEMDTGNLDTYIKDGVKTYALGHDWFENEKAPYPLYSVETEKEI